MSAESSLTAVAVVRALLNEDTEGLAVLLPDGLPEPGRELVASLRSPAMRVRFELNAGVCAEMVGDGPGVAGDNGRGVVDLVDEQGQGAADAG